MQWILDAVNATTENSQNNFSTDICIKDAKIIFEHANVIEIKFSAYKIYDSKNVLIESTEAQKASPDAYGTILHDTVNSYSYILSLENMPSNENGNILSALISMAAQEVIILRLRFPNS